jgi:hypothetical protein
MFYYRLSSAATVLAVFVAWRDTLVIRGHVFARFCGLA